MKKHKVTYVGVLCCRGEPVILAQSFNFSDLPYFSRSQAKNLSVFTAREIAKRVDEGFTGTTIEDYAIYAHKWESGMCILCICDKEYPSRTAFALIQHSFFIFNEKYVYEELDLTKDNNLSLPDLKELLLKYRAPEQVDMYENVFGKVQNTKNIVTKTVKELLNNEESLEALVNQSKDLSAKTKDVFAKSKKLKRRSCCALIENGSKSSKVEAKEVSGGENGDKPVRYKKIFKDCYFCIGDVSVSYREYFEACKGRCTVSVVSFRNRLIDIILKRGGGLEASLSPYVTHFIVERAGASQRWWIRRRIKGTPKKYHFVTAKYVVESHLKGRRLYEGSYAPKFLRAPGVFILPPSNEGTPDRGEGEMSTPSPRQESYRIMETWAQMMESEELEDFKNMDTGIYMNGNIVYIHMENFLVETLIGDGVRSPAAVYSSDQVISVNTEASNAGIRKGMHVKTVRGMGIVDLRLAKYNYDKVIERGLSIVRFLREYSRHILSPYYNEYYLQMPYERSRELLGNSGSKEDDNENTRNVAAKIYSEVPGECVMGLGKNMLVAKLAAKRCRNLKINSQESDYDYEMSPVLSIYGMNGRESLVSENICIVNDGFKFLNNVHLSEIPGVGVLWPVLKSRGLVTCNDVRKKGTPLCLQSILGGRMGKMVYNFCFGYDYRCSNLPRKQLDFFLNKSFKTKAKVSTANSQSSQPSQSNQSGQSVQRNQSSQPSQSSQYTELSQPTEESLLKSMLSDILKQLCSVYSLFDKCIINYSIRYKCTVVIKVGGKEEYSRCVSSILDKESLRHTMQKLYGEIKEEMGAELSDMKTIEFEVKDIIRVDENMKFIDNFLTGKPQSSQTSISRIRGEFDWVKGVNSSDNSNNGNDNEVSGDASNTSSEVMRTPTRRLNGWRIDSIPSVSEPSENSNNANNSNRRNRRTMKSNSSSMSPHSVRSSISADSRRRTPTRMKSESSVESNQRSSSRSRRLRRVPEGQKYITDYISPTRSESKESKQGL